MQNLHACISVASFRCGSHATAAEARRRREAKAQPITSCLCAAQEGTKRHPGVRYTEARPVGGTRNWRPPPTTPGREPVRCPTANPDCLGPEYSDSHHTLILTSGYPARVRYPARQEGGGPALHHALRIEVMEALNALLEHHLFMAAILPTTHHRRKRKNHTPAFCHRPTKPRTRRRCYHPGITRLYPSQLDAHHKDEGDDREAAPPPLIAPSWGGCPSHHLS